jgi:hypothetical protein
MKREIAKNHTNELAPRQMLQDFLAVIMRYESHRADLENFVEIRMRERRGSNQRRDVEAGQRRGEDQQFVQEAVFVKEGSIGQENEWHRENYCEQQSRPQIKMPLLVVDKAEISQRVEQAPHIQCFRLFVRSEQVLGFRHKFFVDRVSARL